MGGQVIDDEMDFLASRWWDDEVGQKRHQFFRRVPLGRLPQDITRLGFEGGMQRPGAITIEFKPMAFGSTGRQWQHRLPFRSSAWMAVFSTTQNTAACCGGFR